VKRAVMWYKLAAEQGLPEAQFRLGFLSEQGRGVPKDDAEAAKWYTQSADHGYAPAMARLGSLYADGKGVAADNHKAYFWLTLATKQNLKLAERQRDQVIKKLNFDDVTKEEIAALNWKAKPVPARNPALIY
jgi:TPR repeat protein